MYSRTPQSLYYALRIEKRGIKYIYIYIKGSVSQTYLLTKSFSPEHALGLVFCGAHPEQWGPRPHNPRFTDGKTEDQSRHTEPEPEYSPPCYVVMFQVLGSRSRARAKAFSRN